VRAALSSPALARGPQESPRAGGQREDDQAADRAAIGLQDERGQ
jgi:hypothetical protein